MDTLPFQNSRRKIERAKTLISELERSIASFFADDWHITKFTKSTDTEIAKLEVTIIGQPKQFSEITGDIIHNLRASLDLMAVEAVNLSGKNSKSVYFPFCRDADFLPQMIKNKKFHKADQKYVDEILALKPYSGGNIALKGLHDLDVLDKHIRLVPASNFVSTPSLGPIMEPDGVTPKIFPNGKVELELKSEPIPNVKYTFPSDFPFAGEPIIPTLHNLVEMVTAIVDRFDVVS